jgi:hypothetical protein
MTKAQAQRWLANFIDEQGVNDAALARSLATYVATSKLVRKGRLVLQVIS